MGPGQSRLLIWTVPTVAIFLSLLWYKRRTGKRGEPGGTKCSPHEIEKPITPVASDSSIDSTEKKTPVSTPTRSPYSRSLSGIDSAPIDIKTNKTPPLIVSDRELDMEIEKIKSMKATVNHSSNMTAHSSASSSTSSLAASTTPVAPPRSPIMVHSSPAIETARSEEGTRDSANHSPADAMLASPSCSIVSDGHHSDSDSGKGGSDVATPPPPVQAQQDNGSIRQIHEFLIPQQLVGRLIGRHGAFVHQIKERTGAHILIKKHPEQLKTVKVCAVEGTKPEIEAALDMIRDKFPEKRYPEVTLEPVTFMDTARAVTLAPDCMHLKLVEGVNNDTIVSCMVTPRHLFLQQPTHPTFPSLNILSAYMNACYSTDVEQSLPPPLPQPVPENTVCAAHSLGAWYRVMITSQVPTDSADQTQDESYGVRFLDYGGFATVDRSTLRQIRCDFLLLPFQAAECVLANVQPPAIAEDGSELWPQEAYDLVTDLTKGAVVVTQVVDYLDDITPLVNIYVRGPSHIIFLNKELVSRGLARWQDH